MYQKNSHISSISNDNFGQKIEENESLYTLANSCEKPESFLNLFFCYKTSYPRMDGPIDRLMDDEWSDGRTDGRKDGQTEGRTDGGTGGWMDGQKDRWMDGRTNRIRDCSLERIAS